MAKAEQQDEVRAKSQTRATAQRVHQLVSDKFGPAVVELVDAVDPYTVVKDHGRFLEIMQFLRDHDDLRMNHLRSVAGVDWPSEGCIDSVYHLYSYDRGHAHTVKFRSPRAAPEAPSVESLWPVANWFEREIYDLLGVIYTGHSDLRRIMLPEDWVGHPLRKDYVEQDNYAGIGTTRASPLEAYAKMDEDRRKASAERGDEPPALQKSPIKPPEGWMSPADKKKAKAAAEKAAAEKAAPKPTEPKPEASPKPTEPKPEASPKPTEPKPEASGTKPDGADGEGTDA